MDTQGITDEKKEIWLANVKFLRLLTWHYMGINIFSVHMCVQF